MKTRKIKITLSILLIFLSLIRCVYAQKPKTQKTPNIRITDDVNSLDWQRGNSIYDRILFCNIMEGLTEVDFSLQVQPALAQEWTVSDDELTYTFRLKENVKWSNGSKVTADNFIQAWKRLLDPAEKNQFSYLLYNVVNAEEFSKGKLKDFSKVGFKTPDDKTIEIRLKKTTNYLPYLMASHLLAPIESKFLSQVKTNPTLWKDHTKVPTTGPYIIEKWIKKKKIDFKFNNQYHGPKPEVEKATYTVIPDITQATQAFLLNDVHVLPGVDDNTVFRIKTTEKPAILETYKYLDTVYLGFNFKSQIFSSLENRKLVSKILNKNTISKLISSKYEAANSLVPSGITGAWTYTEPNEENPIKATNLKNKTIKILASNYAAHHALADIVKDRLLKELNLNATVEIVPAVDLEKTILTHSHDIFIGVLDADIPHASLLLRPFLSNSTRNILALENKDLDYMLNSFEEKSEEENLEPLRIAQKILLKDLVALIPVYHTNTRIFWADPVEHFEVTPLKQVFIKNIRMK